MLPVAVPRRSLPGQIFPGERRQSIASRSLYRQRIRSCRAEGARRSVRCYRLFARRWHAGVGGSGEIAQARGSLTVTLTHNKSSEIAAFADQNIVYEWGDESSVQNNPMAITLALCLEVLQQAEGYPSYRGISASFTTDRRCRCGGAQQGQGRVEAFAETYRSEKLFYVLSSGASYGHAYGFAICSLMEMQWLHASAIHSGEFFHGPFEVTDKQTNFIVLMNEGRTRPLDQRVISFLKRYAERYEVVDARELGIGVLPESVVEFFNPVLFYSVLCDYREALAKIRDHPLETRRFMDKVEY